MLKHNRRKSLRANIPVGLPFDVEGFAASMRDRRKGLTLGLKYHERAKRPAGTTATDEDLE